MTVPLKNSSPQNDVRRYYHALYETWGRQHWWPAQSRFEVIVGAYLTQNTAWTNVEQALHRLRTARVLTLDGIRQLRLSELEMLMRPAGYFRQKAKRLKIFVAYVDQNYGGSLSRMFKRPTTELREELLSLNGVGPETADSILLYAGNHPVFVVDAYTRRILSRHSILPENAPYEEIRKLFELALSDAAVEPSTHLPSAGRTRKKGEGAHPPSRMSRARRSTQAQVFNEAHGLIVRVSKHYCRKSEPDCAACPLQRFLPGGSSQ